ncbi:MAG: (d)CMP kinase [Deltaproteobacteria bacterium]|jgi:cytidylate kinase|nr:(d)CMP kinase [Deltaproteobacteria bacterium]
MEELIQQIITIDGPAGSGKSTISKNLANALGWRYLDTGALYRAVAVAADLMEIYDQESVGALAATLDIKIKTVGSLARVWLGDREITELLRTPGISQLSSTVSAYPEVRAALMGLQRQQGAGGRMVAEGRDMGTVVFPRAGLKFFLTAEPEVRAARRRLELLREGRPETPAEVLRLIMERDQADSTRPEAPLTVPEGAIIVDSTRLSLFEVETIMLGETGRIFGR